MGELRPSAMAPILRGARLGRYVLRQRLGSGAMGVVHVADDTLLQRRVAIKLLHAALGPHDLVSTYDALRQEAHALARLSDPHVVQIFDVGLAFDVAYIAMELVDGVDLRRRWPSCTGAAQRLALVIEAGRGLAAAHRAGVVHGDFKPDNVLCGSGDVIKVADFGLARVIAPAHAPAIGSEQPVSFGGTPSYMAPELHDGKAGDERSDQYAFCVTAYEAIAGRPPFRGGDLAALAAAKRSRSPLPAPSTPGVPRRMIAAILRGLDPRPQARWPTMDRLLRQMRPRAPLRWRWPIAAVAGIAIVLAVGPRAAPCDPAVHAELAPALADADAQWRAAWQTACVAADDGRIACLASRRKELVALDDGLHSGEDGGPIPSDALPIDLACDEGSPAAAHDTAPALARARGLRLAGRHGDARAQALAAHALAVTEAEIAAIEVELGHLAIDEGDSVGGHARFESAFHRARTVDADALAADAALAIASLDAGEIGPGASTWIAHARAASDRAGSPALLTVRIASTECRLATERAALPEAERVCTDALARARASGEVESVESVLSNLGVAHARARRFAESLAIFREQLALRERRIGVDHPGNIGVLLNIGASLQANGDPQAALVMFDRAADVARAQGAELHREYPRIELNRGGAAALLGRHAEAVVHTQNALDALEQTNGDSRMRLFAMYNYGIALHDVGRYADAETVAWRALAWASDHIDADDPMHARLIDLAGDTWSERGDFRRALALHQRASAMAKATIPERNAIRGELDLGVGHDLVALGRHAEAIDVLIDARIGLESEQSTRVPALVAALEILGRARVVTGRPCDAVSDLERAHRLDAADPRVTFTLALALDGCGDADGRARGLAETARAAADDGAPLAIEIDAQIEAWSASR